MAPIAGDDQRLFNTDRPVEITTFWPDKKRVVTVKFPDDTQIERRCRAVQMLVGRARGGMCDVEIIPDAKADRAILSEIRIGGEEMVDAEVTAVLGRLLEAEVIEGSREGSNYRIALDSLGSSTVHMLRIPTEAQMKRWQSFEKSVYVARSRRVELRHHLHIAAELYGQLLVERSGYAEGSNVPIHHKVRIVGRVMWLHSSRPTAAT